MRRFRMVVVQVRSQMVSNYNVLGHSRFEKAPPARREGGPTTMRARPCPVSVRIHEFELFIMIGPAAATRGGLLNGMFLNLRRSARASPEAWTEIRFAWAAY